MTEDQKLEERIRKIVRDEMEAKWIDVGGYADQVREGAFETTKAVLLATCDVVKNSLLVPGEVNTRQ
ncbi:MAG: hypothetical protein KKE77_02125 [Alphaproteobacteria bacterium]|nr:hypothetical protein [Alphaproteobacteria bacterium]